VGILSCPVDDINKKPFVNRIKATNMHCGDFFLILFLMHLVSNRAMNPN